MDFQIIVNGKSVPVPSNLDPDVKLCDFLRRNLFLTGTKYSCREGGCGACAVSLKIFDPVFNKEKFISVNSCLVPLYNLNALEVTTIEGLGDRRRGYDRIQEKLCDLNGSQCGFCSPGFVMTMHAKLKNKMVPPIKDVEDLFDGNICRCTGYRPILDAMKSFASDASPHKNQDGGQDGLQFPMGKNQNGGLGVERKFKSGNSSWVHPESLDELMEVLKINRKLKVKIVFGNTGSGVFKFDSTSFDVFVDLKNILELYKSEKIENGFSFGANFTLTNLINILSQIKIHRAYEKMARHIKKIANVHVRNVGSWSGNLMMKYNHNEFPSDIFVILEAMRARIFITDFEGKKQNVRPSELMTIDSSSEIIITKMILPEINDNFKFNSFKIMPRSQNAHAYVSAAFLMELDKNSTVLSNEIVYGGIGRRFSHAKNAEEFLIGKNIRDVDAIQRAMKILRNEINPETDAYLSSAIYRRNLAITLFYKFILEILPMSKVDRRLMSTFETIPRPISSGVQTFDTDTTKWPLNQPITKLESKSQCAGEAEYIADIPHPPGTLYGTFVTTKIGHAILKEIDASEALKINGVMGFLTHRDIPGMNNCVPTNRPFFFPQSEQLFCSGKVKHAGECVGLLVAETPEISKSAAKLVKVECTSIGPPVLSIKEALKEPERVIKLNEQIIKDGDVEKALKMSRNVIEGEIELGSQFHFHLETQVCLTIPSEDGFEVATSTQWLDGSQQVIAQVLDLPRNNVHLVVRRLGGGYGGKVSRNFHTSTACTLASKIFNRPVFVQMDLETNFESEGKRNPFLAKYRVGFENDGRLDAVYLELFLDVGCNTNEPCMMIILRKIKNVYTCENWLVKPTIVTTNLPSNTYCRTPGSVKAILVMETIMEHISKVLYKNSSMVKSINLEEEKPASASSTIREMLTQLETSAQLITRKKEIAAFNDANRWKKRGMAVTPMKYRVAIVQAKFNVIVSIYNDGGSVVVAHGGVECGQGINTKVAQVCAQQLAIPVDLVRVRPTNTLTNPNSSPTVASTTSELNCLGVVECCKILLERIDPVRKEMKNPTWSRLIHECFLRHVDLCARYMTGPPNLPEGYVIYGACCAEAQVDGLTGEYVISRVDLLFDCGRSLNPELDVGQIEGSFVMGMGLFLTEKVRYCSRSGRNLTRNTWEYFPPTSKDIPVDFRVTMLKNSKNPFGVLKSKTAGEPPLCMSCSVYFAVQKAVDEIRKEKGDLSWLPLNIPASPEEVSLKCGVQVDQLTF